MSCILSVMLDCSFVIDPSVFSNVYYFFFKHKKTCTCQFFTAVQAYFPWLVTVWLKITESDNKSECFLWSCYFFFIKSWSQDIVNLCFLLLFFLENIQCNLHLFIININKKMYTQRELIIKHLWIVDIDQMHVIN